uniref:CRIB domain-containing protein n=1 Tax=Leersia perrieri TaxID=77586 RepID=A0A0D9V9J5_9ORYZ
MSSSGKEQRRMERFIVIPFSSTCRNGSSVDVVDGAAKNSKKSPSGGGGGGGGGGEGENGGGGGKMKGESLMARILRGFKNLSHQIFAVYEEEDEDEEEREMVIGLPTDVKHVAHIGWDGSTSTTSSLRSWNRAAPPPATAAASTSAASPAPAPATQQQAPLPAFSMRQFEMAMAAQAAAASSTAGTSAGGVAS